MENDPQSIAQEMQERVKQLMHGGPMNPDAIRYEVLVSTAESLANKIAPAESDVDSNEVRSALINMFIVGGTIDNEDGQGKMEERGGRDDLLDEQFKDEMRDLLERFQYEWVPPFAKRSLSSHFGGHEKEITDKEKEVYEKLNDAEVEISEIIEAIEDKE